MPPPISTRQSFKVGLSSEVRRMQCEPQPVDSTPVNPDTIAQPQQVDDVLEQTRDWQPYEGMEYDPQLMWGFEEVDRCLLWFYF